MEKKTINVSAKISEPTYRDFIEALSRTGTRTMSRFIQSCIDDLIAKHKAGAHIVEPVELLTEEQRRKLESMRPS